jgi:two-component system response regulator FixJ
MDDEHYPGRGTSWRYQMTREMKYGEALTDREREVVNFIVKGLTCKEIATRFGVSSRTIEVHRHRAMTKLGARNTADLVRITLTGS